jgi:Cytochrome c554 and c-prime
MRGTSIGGVVLVNLVVLTLAGSGLAADHKYVGVGGCKSCHKKELIGNQYEEWRKGEHAKAFETLKGEKAIELAKKKGISGPPHESKECLQCHVTAYGADAAAFDKGPLAASDGVQCESCHGPGKDYRKKKVMSDHDKSIAAGLLEPGKNAEICTSCHNDKSPTWDAAVGFDFEKAKEKIAHPIPEDVKGHYLEIAKKKKAEKGAGAEADEDDEEE